MCLEAAELLVETAQPLAHPPHILPNLAQVLLHLPYVFSRIGMLGAARDPALSAWHLGDAFRSGSWCDWVTALSHHDPRTALLE